MPASLTDPEDKAALDSGAFADVGDDPSPADGTIGRIALKQVRVSRSEVESRSRETSDAKRAASERSSQPSMADKAANPLNRLVPYLDLFCRLTDEELSRLARTPVSAVETLRQQVEEVGRALGRYVDLLPRLSDDELVRLTGATPKTIRFWRLSQPRGLQGDARRTNPDLTPTPQPLPRRETSGVRSVYDEGELGSSERMQIRQVAGDSVSEVSEEESGKVVVDESLARVRREY